MAEHTPPAAREGFEPTAAAMGPVSAPPMIIPTTIGTRKQPAWVMAQPKPYPTREGVWTNWGDQHEGGEHPEPEQERRRVGGPHGRDPHHPHVHQRRRRRPLDRAPGGEQNDGGGEQAEDTAGVPIQAGPSLTATGKVTSHPDIRTPPSQFTPPGARTGDSGTPTNVAAAAPAASWPPTPDEHLLLAEHVAQAPPRSVWPPPHSTRTP